MKKVTIRRYRFDTAIFRHADDVEAALLKEPKTEVVVFDGPKGEFTVMVNGRTVVVSEGDRLPGPDEVVAAVRRASPAEA